MTIKMFHDYMREQLEEIIRHKNKLSEEEKRDVPLEDAAYHFVQTGLAERFYTDYWKDHRVTCEEADVKDMKKKKRCLYITLDMKVIGCAKHHKTVTVDRMETKYCLSPNKCREAIKGLEGLTYCGRH